MRVSHKTLRRRRRRRRKEEGERERKRETAAIRVLEGGKGEKEALTFRERGGTHLESTASPCFPRCGFLTS